LPHFAENPAEIIQLWKGGMSFHGGFLGCVLAVVLFARRRKILILSLGDVTCAVAPIGIFLVRLANFINGELWGRPSDGPWAMVFPGGGPLPRHPSQLYEAALEGLVLFVVLAMFVRFGALKRPGFILGAFALFYGLARSFSQFFREPGPQLGFLGGGLTMGMLLSIPMILGGALIIWLVLRAPARPTCRRSKPNCAASSPPMDRSRLRLTWGSASGTRRTATTRRVIRSAARAISSPRRRSARCSAS